MSLNRRQFVCVKDGYSHKARLLRGVPQGSILEPLLFFIYIKDLSNILNTLSPIMFADDTTLVLAHSICKANSQAHSYSTRQSSDRHPPKFFTCRGKSSIIFRGTKLWNGFSQISQKNIPL